MTCLAEEQPCGFEFTRERVKSLERRVEELQLKDKERSARLAVLEETVVRLEHRLDQAGKKFRELEQRVSHED